MPSPEKRRCESAGPSSSKRRRSEQNNNTQNDASQLTTPTQASQTQEEYSQSGILSWITVKNFMCHEHLNFEFSPHINFIQGRNGSGKSAILAAVVIGLGGTTKFTNRGSSIKDLVKHGKQVATIEIGIKNCGNGAFKPELYGRTIIVERKISVTSTGAYSLKAWDGKVLSTKKDDLTRILDHFNLQVNNPVSLLNQDMSRSFFNTTEPKLLFKFFLKATQLQQMKDDYNNIQQTIQTSLKIIETRKQCLPELQKEVEEQRFHYQFSLSLQEKGKKLKDLRQELAWAKIIQNEKEKAVAEKTLEKNKASRNEIIKKIESLRKSLEETSVVREMKSKLLQDSNEKLSEVAKEIRGKTAEMKKIKNEYKEKQSQCSIAEKKVRGITSEISTLKTAINKDQDRAQSQWAAERAAWQEEMDAVEAEMRELLEAVKTENTHWQNLQHTMKVKTTSIDELNLEVKALYRQLNGLEKELGGLMSQKGSPLTIYGQWVPQLLRKIDVAHSKGLFKRKPVGPLGSFVKVKDTAWAHVAERIFGKRMTSFCVDNKGDEGVLKKLMGEINFDHQPMPIVTVAKFRDKVLDVSRFEVVSPDYRSLWSILSISDTVVANTIIDLMQVESILLIPSAQEAGKLLKDRTTVPRNCKCAYTLNLDQYYPDPNFRVYSGKGSHRARFLQVSVEDKISEINRSKEECQERLHTLNEEKEALLKEKKNLDIEMNASNKKTQISQRKYNASRTKLADLQNQETPPPPDVARLEDEVVHMEDKLQNAIAQMEKVRESMSEYKTKFSEMEGSLKELKVKEKDVYREVEEHKNELDQCNVYTAKSGITNLKKKDQELKQKEKILQKELTESIKTLEDAMKIADQLEIGPRRETNKSVKSLEQMYFSLQAKLNKERESSGDPISIAERYIATKQRYKQISEDLNRHQSFVKKLNESLQMRTEKYVRFHRWLAVIVQYFFKENLSVRKLEGSITINMKDQSLELHVEKANTGTSQELTPVQNGTPGKRRKLNSGHTKLVMMSGGERSFATVSFIIALWHVIASPLRILDEFDVFMDVIARNRAMNMMINSAKADTQYIFLTPLSVDTNKLRNCVFFRMPDPEREEDHQE